MEGQKETMLHILICDEDSIQIDKTTACLHEYSKMNNLETQIRTAKSLEEMLFKLNQFGDIIDIIITETLIHGENIIDLIEEINYRLPDIKTIFISKHQHLVFQAYKVRHECYLPTPIDNIMFCHIMKRVISDLEAEQKKYISLSKQGLITRICLDDICYFESNLHSLNIVTKNGKYTFKEKLDSMKSMLDNRFVQCHKSFIVNMSFIVEMKELNFNLLYGDTIPISSRRQKDTKDAFEYFILQYDY